MSSDLLWKLAVQRISFLKTDEKRKVLAYCINSGRMPERKTLVDLIRRDFRSSYKKESILHEAENDLSLMIKQGIFTLSVDDEAYPEKLRSIHNPPFLLYGRGETLLSDVLNISVVGTRKATGLAMEKAFALSFHLARSGAAVTSGLASGTDSAAHSGALAGKGYTLAVFGCGIDRIYPSSSKDLAARILDEGGTLLSEYPPGIPPVRYNFPERNRIVSALSEALVVVESPARSGALITADFALEQGRDVFVLNAASPSPSAGEGTNSLIEDGAVVVESADDVLRELSYSVKSRDRSPVLLSHSGSRATGRFLADRFRAELEEREISREGVYYSL
ncbi:DNA-processing protein DprA [Spirochaeta isovalerica]|uniref:DNA processing protein n=1 Tax=Spirochaeta isovalerica TaxID=150 RepID=A0A841RHG3_9SPIO|nr:DNA-processing protein DprA [Spirochaeta isovalerica]MBB6481968.1 DNA processing protein [Spirochaeta isovalerica]